MTARVSIIMGSTSDLPVMEKAAKVLNDFNIHSNSLYQLIHLYLLLLIDYLDVLHYVPLL